MGAYYVYRLYGVESEFLSPTAVKARLPILRTEDLLVCNLAGVHVIVSRRLEVFTFMLEVVLQWRNLVSMTQIAASLFCIAAIGQGC